MNKKVAIKGRGAAIGLANPFEKRQYDHLENWLDEYVVEEKPGTEIVKVRPKTIVNTTVVPGTYEMVSMNPYQGCEHGCSYCYARPTHNYWGYSAALDFEQKILVKENAPALLDKKLASRNWKAKPILLSGNTDCYQPLEKKFKLTRKILKVFLKYKHPVAIITKNALILRDLDVLKELAALNLVQVVISVTTLKESLRREMEPRTSSVNNRIRAIRELSENGIPVSVMIAPVIPGLNNVEIPNILKSTAVNGAIDANYQVVRLKDDVGKVFKDWLKSYSPEKYKKVMNQIKEFHGGKTWQNHGYKSESAIRKSVHKLFEIHKKKYFSDKPSFELNMGLYRSENGDAQLGLF